jgi:DNA-directed RNA polymerase specialized sigma24 family protein
MAKQAWQLNDSALTALLVCLDTDAERAGEKYEVLRLKLIKFFDWRRAHYPEELADETLNRVMRKLDEGARLEDVSTYCLGVARFVWRESLRNPEQHHTDLEEAAAHAAPAAPDHTDLQACFEHCLSELPLESRQLILRYYQDERRQKIDQRLALAEQLGIPLNALRSRAQRIRDRLEQCIADCQNKFTRRAT